MGEIAHAKMQHPVQICSGGLLGGDILHGSPQYQQELKSTHAHTHTHTCRFCVSRMRWKLFEMMRFLGFRGLAAMEGTSSSMAQIRHTLSSISRLR